MRVALISDVHANLHALEVVLADVMGAGVDEIWCLGDVVGYGAFPNECAALVAERTEICLAGNHDLVIVGDLPISEFSASAADAARWTAQHLEDEGREYLQGLSPYRIGPDHGLYHASPRDPVWEYVLALGTAAACMRTMPLPVSFVGHSHVPLHFELRDGDTSGSAAQAGETIKLGGEQMLINPGSVGQPRDGDRRAAYAVLDTEEETVEYCRLEYPIEKAAEAIREAGLPPELGERLFRGR